MIVRRYVAEVANRRNLAAIDELSVDEAVEAHPF